MPALIEDPPVPQLLHAERSPEAPSFYSGNGLKGAEVNAWKLAEKYVQVRIRQGAKRGTVANLRWALDLFVRFMGQRPLERIGQSDVERWMEHCGGYSPASRRALLSSARCFLRWAERHKHVRRNVALNIKGPRQPRMLPRALPTGGPAKVLTACPDARARFIVTLMLQQGLRCVEISRLELHDIDTINETMMIRGKGDHERLLPLLAETREALFDYLAEHPCTAGPLVRSYTRREALTAGSISRLTSGWMLAAGVKSAPRDGVSAHSNRHTAATDMLLNGAHLRDVQTALGHAHLATTERYIPFVVKGLADAMGGRTYYSGSRRTR